MSDWSDEVESWLAKKYTDRTVIVNEKNGLGILSSRDAGSDSHNGSVQQPLCCLWTNA